MRPPLAGKRAAARRLAEEVRRRLEPVERVLPVRLPGGGRAVDGAAVDAAGERCGEGEPSAEDAAARIDAARERLRATIEPPADPGD
jgi:hypothetical protein